jgi:putative ABC transport system permease protein
MPAADLQSVSADYFRTLRIPLLRGRGISDSDGRTAPAVAVISDRMAKTFWPR